MAHSSERHDHDERWNEVLEEHRELQRHLALLTDWVAVKPPRPDGWEGELARRAAQVVKDVEKHFAGEAEEKFFRDLETKTPHLSHEVMSLRKEHGTILSELRGFAAGSGGPGGRDADRLAARVRATVALINRHEARETELMFRSIYEDMGVGD